MCVDERTVCGGRGGVEGVCGGAKERDQEEATGELSRRGAVEVGCDLGAGGAGSGW